LDSYVAPAPYSYGEEEDEEEDFGINEESFGTVSSTSSKEYSEEGNEETTTEKPKKLRKTQLKKDLKEYRMSQKKDGEAAYTVFTNAALEGIYASLPMTESELLEVKGIGPKKLELYGDDILALVAPYVGMGGRQRDLDEASSDTDTPIQPEIIAPESLTDEQRRAAGLIFGNDNEEEGRRKNVFVTGSAGTGKSHLLKYVVEILQGRQNYPGDGIYYATDFKVGVCAPTGVAAVIVGGSTLHSFFGIGLGTGSKSSILQKVYRNAGAKTRIDETDVLIIDECSMLSSDLLETLDMVARTVRKEGIFSEEPFGGMQVIAFGDFFQLPPVYRYDGSHDRRWRPFCFDSPVWTELGLSENIVELKEVQRQEEGDFVNLLSKVRNGSVVRKDIEDLNRKCLVGPNNPLPNDGILPTRLYVLNRDVDLENTTRLRELDGKEVVCKAKDVWRQKMPFGTPAAVKKKMKEGLDLQMPEEIRLKIGAQVMLTRNKDLDRNLVNGSRGVVERFERGRDGNSIPIVRFDSGLITRIDPVESALYNTSGGEGCLVRMQVPLKLAWAITIHKSQGSTLTRASLDIASAFEYGQCYVALSRVRSLDGLWLERPAELRNVMVSPQVVDFLSRE
jgi:ATP-dependent DNA helicase PIF1